ncbi:MAG: hypothetical protein GXX91_03535 [Verrucomicrobiaceae bacterium]|nr:hypothetical protein [Verrucomicrobiaceae bacterium]
MTMEAFLESIRESGDPPADLSEELRSLWLAKAGRWEESHDIAQEIPSATGSWIHGLLHAIEGDSGNAAYWFQKAGRPAIQKSEIDAEWDKIVRALL